ncbi:MAG TPA: DUF885 family protein [Ginsengibacter sp.]|nr:DUF885 family protein [Ginsengibacter sp.]HRP44692.1 DUF885 family protein [Ginsengibacter sp.]
MKPAFLNIRMFLFIFLSLLSYGSFAQKEGSDISGEELITNYYADVQDLGLVYVFKNSDEHYNRFKKLYNDWLSRLKSISFNRLSKEDQVDYILLKRNILSDQQVLEQNRKDFLKVQYSVPFSPRIISLQQTRRRGDNINAQEAAKSLSGVIKEIQAAKLDVIKNPIETEELRSVAVRSVEELQKGLQNVNSFYNNYDPDFTWWMKKTYPETDAALSDYAKWLAKQSVQFPGKAMDNSGIIGNPIGKDELERQLRFEFIPYSPEQLIQIAAKQYDWCLNEMKKASRAMGYGDDWEKALEKVKQNFLPPGKQPQLVNELQEFAMHMIDSLGLVTIPDNAREAWRMVMLSPEQMRFASYFLGGPMIMVAYANEEQDYDTKMMIMRSGNYSFARAEVFHELIPGHNLQFYMNKRYRSYRRQFSTPFNVEGWAFYWEMILWDNGYNRTPEEKIGALFWRMTRCARIVFSLNYHLKNWTPQQCIDYLVEKVGLERFVAESEVRRSFTGGYGPLYQLAYMIGALQMYELHKEVVGGKKMTDRQFNDAFLHNGTMPIEMFRALVTDQKLSPDFITRWRFAEESLR